MDKKIVNDFSKNFTIAFAISFLIALVTSVLWSRAAEDSLSFWLASCNLEVNISNAFCSVIRPERLMVGKKVLETYPKWTTFLFYFPARIEFQQFSYFNKFLGVTAFSLSFAIIAWLNKFKVDSRLSLALVFTSLSMFVPLRDMFRSGQISWIQLLSLVFFLIFFHQNSFSEQFHKYRLLLAGLFLAVSAIKPQALYLLYFYLLVISLKRYQLLSKVFLIFLICLGILIIFKTDPIANQAVLNSLTFKLQPFFYWRQPVLADLFFPKNPSARILFLFLTLACSAIYFQTLRNSYLAIILIVVPLSLLTTPYGFSYDFILLLPALVYLLSNKYFQTHLILFLMLALGINYASDLIQKSCIVYPIFILILGLWAYYRENRIIYGKS